MEHVPTPASEPKGAGIAQRLLRGLRHVVIGVLASILFTFIVVHLFHLQGNAALAQANNALMQSVGRLQPNTLAGLFYTSWYFGGLFKVEWLTSFFAQTHLGMILLVANIPIAVIYTLLALWQQVDGIVSSLPLIVFFASMVMIAFLIPKAKDFGTVFWYGIVVGPISALAAMWVLKLVMVLASHIFGGVLHAAALAAGIGASVPFLGHLAHGVGEYVFHEKFTEAANKVINKVVG